MELKKLKTAVELNEELKEIEEVKRVTEKHAGHWWVLKFPGSDSVDLNCDTLRKGIYGAIESAEKEILKKIEEL